MTVERERGADLRAPARARESCASSSGPRSRETLSPIPPARSSKRGEGRSRGRQRQTSPQSITPAHRPPRRAVTEVQVAMDDRGQPQRAEALGLPRSSSTCGGGSRCRAARARRAPRGPVRHAAACRRARSGRSGAPRPAPASAACAGTPRARGPPRSGRCRRALRRPLDSGKQLCAEERPWVAARRPAEVGGLRHRQREQPSELRQHRDSRSTPGIATSRRGKRKATARSRPRPRCPSPRPGVQRLHLQLRKLSKQQAHEGLVDVDVCAPDWHRARLASALANA